MLKNSLLNCSTDKLWIKKKIKFDEFNKKEIIFQTKLKINSDNNKNLKTKEFILTNSKIYYLKQGIIKGYINYSKLYSKKEDLIIKISNSLYYFEIKFEEYKTLNLWYKEIKKLTLEINIFNDYKIIEKITEKENYNLFILLNKNENKKYISKSYFKNSNQINRKLLINEIQILLEIDNEYILKFIEVIENNDTINIIFEYSNYGSLYDFINDSKNINDQILQNIIKKILLSLEYIHSKKIILEI